MAHHLTCNRVEHQDMNSLNARAIGGNLFLMLAIATLLFGPAGTIGWWQAWALLAVFGGAALAITAWLMKHDPALLERRLSAGPTAEKETSQKVIMTIASGSFIALMVI